MKQEDDKTTAEPVAELPLANVPARRGRKPVYCDSAERVRAWRARHNLRTMVVDLPGELLDELEAYMQFKNLTKRQVIEKLIRTQLLRKR